MGVEDKKFELLLKDKMHKELIKKLDDILKKINSKDISVDLSSLEKSISKISIKDEINEIPNSILALSNVILDKIKEIKTQKNLTEWEFDVYRDNNGFIESVKAKGK